MDVATPSGAIVRQLRSDAVSVHVLEATSIEQICGPVQAGLPTPGHVAAGIVRGTATDNDVLVSGTRRNVWKVSATGIVQAPDGSPCHLSARFHASLDRDGEFRLLSEWIRLGCR